MIVDIHTHLDHVYFSDDLDEVIERAKKAGVVSIITSGVNHSSNLKALEISKKYDIVNASLGLYPVDALAAEVKVYGLPRETEATDVDEEIKFIEKNKDNIIGIGEAGMDFSLVKGKEKEQKEIFQKIIELAEKINKPLIVHSRKAEQDVLDLLESSKLKKVVMHCFGGRMKLVEKAHDLGYFFTIPTVITRLKHFEEVVKRISLQKILTETDAPYLSPYKEKRNEPAFIVETIKKISEIKKLDRKEVENLIFMNYQKLFL